EHHADTLADRLVRLRGRVDDDVDLALLKRRDHRRAAADGEDVHVGARGQAGLLRPVGGDLEGERAGPRDADGEAAQGGELVAQRRGGGNAARLGHFRVHDGVHDKAVQDADHAEQRRALLVGADEERGGGGVELDVAGDERLYVGAAAAEGGHVEVDAV